MIDPVLKRIFVLTALALLLYLLYLLLPVVLPFAVAFLLAYLFSSWTKAIQNIGLPRWMAVTAVFILIIVVILMVAWYLVPMLWAQINYVKDHIPEMIRWVNHTFLPWVSRTFDVQLMEFNTDEMSKVVMDYIQKHYSVNNLQDIGLRAFQSGLNIIQIGGTLVLVPIITFYLMLDWEKMLVHLRRAIPRPIEAQTLQIVQECHQVLGAFVKGQFLVMVLLGVVYATGLHLIGVQMGLIIGLVAGLASIIPYLGFAVGIVAALIATLFQFGVDWLQLFLVIVVFMIGQMVEGYILQPFLLGDKIGLPPVAVVFAVLAGAQLFGFAGMLLALPVAAVIVVLLRHLRNSYERSHLYGAIIPLTDEVSPGDTAHNPETSATADDEAASSASTEATDDESSRND